VRMIDVVSKSAKCIDGIFLGTTNTTFCIWCAWDIHEIQLETFCLTVRFVDPFQDPTIVQCFLCSVPEAMS